MFREIKQCRICGNNDLAPVLSLGVQSLTGVFPKSRKQQVTCGPLELVRCHGSHENACGLVQLKHSFDLQEMYGDNYGYRSGLNNSMVRHLQEKVHNILKMVILAKGDLVIDVGSNDSTLLQAYGDKGYLLAGIDPTGKKFREYYPPHINLIPDFFSGDMVQKYFGNKKAKIVTSISMFYDLESPIDFSRQVCDVLADDGLWIMEQSYLPAMIEKNAYDTICHEHLEYYSLRQIRWICDKVGLKIIDVEENSVNGGSFSVVLAKLGSSYEQNEANIRKLLGREKDLSLEITYRNFKERVFDHQKSFIEFVREKKAGHELVLGYGASTKGNVILQFCGFTVEDIPYIAEINEDKFGAFTPGTHIPIISEKEARQMKPDYFMILPWHFKDNIIAREREYLKSGGRLLFPLPAIEVV